MLPQDIDIGLSDGVRIKHAVGPIAVLLALRRSYTAVDDEMGYVNTLGSEFPRRALRKTAKGEFTRDAQYIPTRITADGRDGFTLWAAIILGRLAARRG